MIATGFPHGAGSDPTPRNNRRSRADQTSSSLDSTLCRQSGRCSRQINAPAHHGGHRIRVPHFIGLHAWQVLPLFVLLVLRRGSARTRTAMAVAASGLYAAVFVGLLVQALRGGPVLPL